MRMSRRRGLFILFGVLLGLDWPAEAAAAAGEGIFVGGFCAF